MLAELIRQNLDDHPEKRRDFARLTGRVSIVAQDSNVSATLMFEGGQLRVHGGIVGIPDVTVRTTIDQLMNMSLVELRGRLRLPDPRGEATRTMLEAQKQGQIRIYGMWPNIPLLLRLTRVMSVN